MQTVTMTEEEKAVFDAKKKAAAIAYKERKAAAKAVITSWLESNPEAPNDVLEAVKYLSGQSSPRSASVNNELIDFLSEPKTSMQVYKKFEYGRPTMQAKIKSFIKKAPESRVWIAFTDGTYSIAGTGAEAPEGWTGFVPVEKAEL